MIRLLNRSKRHYGSKIRQGNVLKKLQLHCIDLGWPMDGKVIKPWRVASYNGRYGNMKMMPTGPRIIPWLLWQKGRRNGMVLKGRRNLYYPAAVEVPCHHPAEVLYHHHLPLLTTFTITHRDQLNSKQNKKIQKISSSGFYYFVIIIFVVLTSNLRT